MICRRLRSGVVLALCVALVPAAGAGAIYKYRDADGIVHYTDRRPGAQQPVEIFQLFGASPAQRRTVFVEKRGAERQDVYVVNRNQAPVEVSFHLMRQENIRSQSIPAHWLVPARGETKIASLQPLNAEQPLRYDYRMRWQLGDPNAKPNQRFVYSPPVPVQNAFTIAQGFNGSYSHHTASSRYAIDIDMPIGTAIRAARGGLVVSVNDSNRDGGNSVAYRSQTNSIYVLHDDGTFAIYAHLRCGSALVRPGERIQIGQIIAQSGNTGYSTGPHLHFAVLRNAGMQWQSVPFELASPYGAVKPVRGMAVTGMAVPDNSVASRDR